MLKSTKYSNIKSNWRAKSYENDLRLLEASRFPILVNGSHRGKKIPFWLKNCSSKRLRGRSKLTKIICTNDTKFWELIIGSLWIYDSIAVTHQTGLTVPKLADVNQPPATTRNSPPTTTNMAAQAPERSRTPTVPTPVSVGAPSEPDLVEPNFGPNLLSPKMGKKYSPKLGRLHFSNKLSPIMGKKQAPKSGLKFFPIKPSPPDSQPFGTLAVAEALGSKRIRKIVTKWTAFVNAIPEKEKYKIPLAGDSQKANTQENKFNYFRLAFFSTLSDFLLEDSPREPEGSFHALDLLLKLMSFCDKF